MALLIRQLERFSNRPPLPVQAWYHSQNKDQAQFLDYMFYESTFGLSPIGKIRRWCGFSITEKQKVKQKRRVYDALRKAREERTKDGYTRSFSYIAYPVRKQVHDPMVVQSTFPLENSVDDSVIYVTPQGRDFLTLNGFVNDFQKECGTLVTILVSLATGLIGAIPLSQFLTYATDFLQSWP